MVFQKTYTFSAGPSSKVSKNGSKNISTKFLDLLKMLGKNNIPYSPNDDLMVIYHGTQQEINEKTIMNESKVMNDQDV